MSDVIVPLTGWGRGGWSSLAWGEGSVTNTGATGAVGSSISRDVNAPVTGFLQPVLSAVSVTTEVKYRSQVLPPVRVPYRQFRRKCFCHRTFCHGFTGLCYGHRRCKCVCHGYCCNRCGRFCHCIGGHRCKCRGNGGCRYRRGHKCFGLG